MALGEIFGYTKDWSQQEINEARNAGQFFKPVSNTPKPTPTTTPTPLQNNATIPTSIVSGNNTIGNGNLTTPINGNIMGGGFYANSGLNTQGTPTPAPKINPIGAAINANPNYQSPATQQYTPIQNVEPKKVSQVDNIVDTVTQILNKLGYNQQPLTQKENVNYVSPYNQQIQSSLQQLQNYQSKPYDPNSDIGLQSATKYAQQNTYNTLAKKGTRVFDPYAQQKLQEVGQQLIPQYQQMYNQNQQQQYNNIANTLGALSGLENSAFNQNQAINQNINSANQNNVNRLISTVGLASGLQGQGFNQDVTKAGMTGNFQGDTTIQEQQRQRDNEIQLYGTELTPSIRQSVVVNQSMPPEFRALTDKYKNDYAAEINRRQAINPNDPLLPYLYAARTQKILSTPQLLQQYGRDLGIANPTIEKMAMEYQAKQLEIKINGFKAQYADKQAQAELDKVLAEVKKLDFEAAMKKLEASVLPAQLQYQLMQEMAKVNLIKSQTQSQLTGSAADMARAGLYSEQAKSEVDQRALTKARIDTEKTQQAKNTASAKGDLEKFDYDAFDRIDKYVQSNFMQKTKQTTYDGEMNPSTQETTIVIPEKKEELQKYLYSVYSNKNFDNRVAQGLLAKYNIPEPELER